MITTVDIDDELFARARQEAGTALNEKELLTETVKVFLRLRAAQRLALLGGQQPDMTDIPRNRDDV